MYAESRLFELIPYSPVHTHFSLSPDADGSKTGQSASTIDTTGDNPCAYLYADFQRQPPANEQLTTTVIARHNLHSTIIAVDNIVHGQWSWTIVMDNRHGKLC